MAANFKVQNKIESWAPVAFTVCVSIWRSVCLLSSFYISWRQTYQQTARRQMNPLTFKVAIIRPLLCDKSPINSDGFKFLLNLYLIKNQPKSNEWNFPRLLLRKKNQIKFCLNCNHRCIKFSHVKTSVVDQHHNESNGSWFEREEIALRELAMRLLMKNSQSMPNFVFR